MRRGCALVVAVLSLASCSTPPAPAFAVEIQRDVPFAVRGARRLRLDVYRPREAGACPAVIWIHGGGWRAAERPDAAHLAQLAARGFVGVAVDHRPSTEAPYPAPLEDVRAAVRFLRARAPELGIDPDRIGVWGLSSGGHLALLTALAGDADPSVRVQAACAWFAPTDLTSGELEFVRDDVDLLVGKGHDSMFAKAASPLFLVSPDDPPVLLFHGADDYHVPPSQSHALAKAMRSAGAEAELVLVRNARHGFEPFQGEPDPSKNEILDRSMDFFEKHLR